MGQTLLTMLLRIQTVCTCMVPCRAFSRGPCRSSDGHREPGQGNVHPPEFARIQGLTRPLHMQMVGANLMATEGLGLEEAVASVREEDKEAHVLLMVAEYMSLQMVCAYLMATEGLSLAEAVQSVREKRRVTCPNSGFLQQLKLWEDMGCKLDEGNPKYRSAFRSPWPLVQWTVIMLCINLNLTHP